MTIDWDFLAEDKSLKGRDLESRISGVTERGPLQAIIVEGEDIKMGRIWSATQCGSRWVRSLVNVSAGGVKSYIGNPSMQGDGTIYFAIPRVGEFRILPAGDNLDPAIVHGLSSYDVEALYKLDREMNPQDY